MPRGFTLLEVIIATFILTIGAVGVFTLVTHTTRFSSTATNQLVASYLAQEGVEIVRNIRDTNFVRIRKGVPGATWKDGLTGCAAMCEADYNDSSLTPVGSLNQLLLNGIRYTYDSGVPSPFPFARNIAVTINGPDTKMDVLVEVSWQERQTTRSVKAATELYKWLAP